MSNIMIRALLLTLISGLSLQGCAQPKPERLGAPIEGYSHTSAAINRFSVNGNGGPNLAPYGYGGGQMCCAPMPVKWHPGLTVVAQAAAQAVEPVVVLAAARVAAPAAERALGSAWGSPVRSCQTSPTICPSRTITQPTRGLGWVVYKPLRANSDRKSVV